MSIYLRGKKIAGGGRNLATNNPALIRYNVGQTSEQYVSVQDNNIVINSNTIYKYPDLNDNTVQSQMYLPIVAGDNVSFTSDGSTLKINSISKNIEYNGGVGINVSVENDVGTISWTAPYGIQNDFIKIAETIFGYEFVYKPIYIYDEHDPIELQGEMNVVLPIVFGEGMSAVIEDNKLNVSATGIVAVEKFSRSV